MSQRSLFRLLGPPGLVAGLSAASVVVASASFFVITPPIDLSLPSPFADCTVGGPGTNYPNSEVEPWVAVNPTNPNTIVAVFQQDRWSNGGAHGLVAKTSHNGGASWSTSWAHFSTCSGGTAANGGDYDRASDPWVTIAPNGDVFQISLSASADLVTSAVLVSKSTDGGDTWAEPTTLIKDSSPFNFNDKESITADPTKPGYVYAVWDRSRLPSENADINALHSYAFRGDVMFARTTNGGASWEPARDVLPRNANLSTIGNQIIVLPDGTLLDVFNLLKGSGNQPHGLQTFQAVMRSTDKGMSWSSPIIISSEEAVAVITVERCGPGPGCPTLRSTRATGPSMWCGRTAASPATCTTTLPSRARPTAVSPGPPPSAPTPPQSRCPPSRRQSKSPPTAQWPSPTTTSGTTTLRRACRRATGWSTPTITG